MHPLRRLVIHGLNELLARELVSLAPTPRDQEDDENGHIFLDLCGRSSVVLWGNAGHGELRVSVWWDFDPHSYTGTYRTSRPVVKPQHYAKIVGALASAWLERKDGTWLQGEERDRIFDSYVRQSSRQALEQIAEATPNGFRSTGPFMM